MTTLGISSLIQVDDVNDCVVHSNSPKEGAFIHGLYMEGARWDVANNCIGPPRLKDLCPLMPVLYIKAITQDKQETKNIYECPVYRTRLYEARWQ